MANTSKGYRSASEKIDRTKQYPLPEAVALTKSVASAKFDETVEIAIRIGVDPRKADQNIRGTVLLPHGTGRTVRVAVFAKGEKAKEAEDNRDALQKYRAEKKGTTVEKMRKDASDEFDKRVKAGELYRRGGKVKKMASGGMTSKTSSASKRADGCCSKGKTRGKMY